MPTDLHRAASIREALQSGGLVDDRVFDGLYPVDLRRASRVHWTPVEVAARAAGLLGETPGLRLLDVGSGVGKFCIVAAAASRARVSGVEHRRHLVQVAEDASARVGVTVDFTLGTLEACDPRDYDGVYLFNPFAENLATRDDYIDDTVELNGERFFRDIATTERFLQQARDGMRVVTYCGWGGSMPPDYRLALRESRAGRLELWVKQ